MAIMKIGLKSGQMTRFQQFLVFLFRWVTPASTAIAWGSINRCLSQQSVFWHTRNSWLRHVDPMKQRP